LKVDESHWQQKYPIGVASTFRITSAIETGGLAGTIIRLLPDEKVEVLIPPLDEGALLRIRETGEVH